MARPWDGRRRIEITKLFSKMEKGVSPRTFVKQLDAEIEKAQTGRWPMERSGMKITCEKGMYGAVRVFLEGNAKTQ